MKLGILSDLHLEFRESAPVWQALQKKINESGCDLVINAGDIHPIPAARERFHEAIRVPYEHILGNHDFYGQQKLMPSRFVRDMAGLKVVGATLWTDFDRGDPLTMARFKGVLADGRQILAQGQSLVGEMLEIHRRDLEFIDGEKPDVVVTHHAPSKKSVNAKFANAGFTNYYFMSELDQFILDHPHIKLWIHGHMHDESNYMIGNTRVIAHPLGYPGETYKHTSQYEVLQIGV